MTMTIVKPASFYYPGISVERGPRLGAAQCDSGPGPPGRPPSDGHVHITIIDHRRGESGLFLMDSTQIIDKLQIPHPGGVCAIHHAELRQPAAGCRASHPGSGPRSEKKLGGAGLFWRADAAVGAAAFGRRDGGARRRRRAGGSPRRCSLAKPCPAAEPTRALGY